MKKIICLLFVFLIALAIMSGSGIASEKSKVVIVVDKTVFDGYGNVNKEVLENMLNVAVKEFFGVNKPEDGWKKVFDAEDKVAIKVNTLAAAYACNNSTYKAVSHPELAYAVANGIISAGVKLENIIIYDRRDLGAGNSPRETMGKSGFELNNSPGKIKILEGGEYGPVEILSNGLKVNFLKFLYECNKVVNVPILKGHHIMGFTFALKNHLGSFKDADTKLINEGVPSGSAGSLHKNAGVPGVASLNSHPILKNKSKLIIGDMLRIQYRTAFYDPEGSYGYNGIIIGTDPVAVDAIVWDIIKKKRQEEGINYFITTSLDRWYMASPAEREQYKSYPDKMKYGGTAGTYLNDCAKSGLGNDELNNIELKVIELKK